MIKSRRHPVKFYLLFLFLTVFFTVLSIGVWYFSYKAYNEQGLNLKLWLPILLSIIVSISTFYVLFNYFRNVPIVKFDYSHLWFNNKRYGLSEIEKVHFSGKQRFPIKPGVYYFEALTIMFKNGEIVSAFDTYYSNLWELKLALYNSIDITKQASIPVIKNTGNILHTSEAYKSNQFTTFRGIMLWFVIAWAICCIFISPSFPPVSFLIFLISFCFCVFILNSICMYYPTLTYECVTIKNHNFLWVNKEFRLDNIRECVFDTHPKWPNCLRIITKDFKQHLYPCSTLRNKQWLALKNHIESKGIHVRNECIFNEAPSFSELQ